jgi:hypothetical protein
MFTCLETLRQAQWMVSITSMLGPVYRIIPIHLLTRAGMQPCDTPNSPETQGKSRLIMVDHHQSHRDGLCISQSASLEPLSFLHAFGTAFLASFTDASIESTWDIAPNQRLSKLGVRKSTRRSEQTHVQGFIFKNIQRF